MSFSLAAGIVETVLLEALATSPFRAIEGASSTIIADVTIEEAHDDQITATKHPVEAGAAITDHSYKEPAKLTLRVGWSDSGNYDGYVSDVYASLLTLQQARGLLNVYTGKRVYQNMLLVGLTTMTDEKNEYSMMVVARLDEIIIVSTQTTTLPTTSNQANPANTAPPANGGQQQTTQGTSADQSLLSSATGKSVN
jgi:hypothetical protein